MSVREFQQARKLLWALVEACGERMRRCPHATIALSRERDRYAAEAIRLTAADIADITRINSELPQRLEALQGSITWHT